MGGRAGAPLHPSSGGGRRTSQTLLHTPRRGQAGWDYRPSMSTALPDPDPRGLLDASRGPLQPLAARTLEAAVAAAWADPTRLHPAGRRARALLDGARDVLATALGVHAAELSVHASPEAALELGLTGLRHARRRTGDRVVAGATERSAVLLQPGTEPPVPV